MNRNTVAQWFKQFQKARRSMKNDACTQYSSTTIDNTLTSVVSVLLDEDRRIMVREIEGVTGTPKTTMHHILTKYLMKKNVAAQWLLHMLFPAQKTLYGTVAETFDSLQKRRDCNFARNNRNQ